MQPDPFVAAVLAANLTDAQRVQQLVQHCASHQGHVKQLKSVLAALIEGWDQEGDDWLAADFDSRMEAAREMLTAIAAAERIMAGNAALLKGQGVAAAVEAAREPHGA